MSCPNCKNEAIVHEEDYNMWAIETKYVDQDGHNELDDYVENIKYCPFCGCRLDENAPKVVGLVITSDKKTRPEFHIDDYEDEDE